MKQHYLFANWKVYVDVSESVRLARHFAAKRPQLVMTIFPSHVALLAVATVLAKSSIAVGVQSVDAAQSGAATGAVLAEDAAEIGAKYALIGHSEVRARGMTDVQIAEQLCAAADAGLIPVLCVGEQKQTTRARAQSVVHKQLVVLKGWKGKQLFVAYEPVWAISKSGKGKACPPEHAAAMATFIQREVKRRLPRTHLVQLYGGSVNGKNIAQFVDGTMFHGALVGFASTKPLEMKAMAQAIS